MAVRCEDLVHIYPAADSDVIALRSVDLAVESGETVAVLGPSGAGKSTLLWLLAGLRRPSAGRIYLGRPGPDRAVQPRARPAARGAIGVVLQDPARNLLPYLSYGTTSTFAQQATVLAGQAARRYADGAARCGRARPGRQHQGGRLSGGEQQRLAVAVALANRPRVLLVDEPTSQLDRGPASG